MAPTRSARAEATILRSGDTGLPGVGTMTYRPAIPNGEEISRPIEREEAVVIVVENLWLDRPPAPVGPMMTGMSALTSLDVLDLPTSGTVRIRGQDLSALDDPKRSRLRGDAIGFVFQHFNLVPHLTALG